MIDTVRKWLNENQGKKIVVIYGNCHTTAIRYKIEQLGVLENQYSVFPFEAIQNVKDPSYFECGILENCDLFIHQVIRENNRYGMEWSSKEIIKKLKPSCSVIGIPNLYHLPMCFFQQYSEKKDFCGPRKNTVFFRDIILDDAYINKWSKEYTVKFYSEEDLGDSSKVENDFEAFMRRVISRESEWDIKISDYILDNYKDYKLFYDPNHPTPYIINEITKRLLDKIGIRYPDMDSVDDYLLDSFEIPTCGYTKKSLGLRFDDKEIRKTGIKWTKEKMNLEKYIDEYWTYEWQNPNISIWRRSVCATRYLKAFCGKHYYERNIISN